MKQLYRLLLLILVCKLSHIQSQSIPVTIQWADSIPGDFSFTQNWSFLEGIVPDENGRAHCGDGGLCPERIYGMLDRKGNVKKDSLEVYYQVLDTTHYKHSISCDAWCYEWAGTDFMHARKQGRDTVFCYTECNIATHCGLELYLVGNTCYASIGLVSIVRGGSRTFYCTAGTISIDKALWNKGILKASFSFDFNNTTDSKKLMYWRGLVYTQVKT